MPSLRISLWFVHHVQPQELKCLAYSCVEKVSKRCSWTRTILKVLHFQTSKPAANAQKMYQNALFQRKSLPNFGPTLRGIMEPPVDER